jgi:hypothetical protein
MMRPGWHSFPTKSMHKYQIVNRAAHRLATIHSRTKDCYLVCDVSHNLLTINVLKSSMFWDKTQFSPSKIKRDVSQEHVSISRIEEAKQENRVKAFGKYRNVLTFDISSIQYAQTGKFRSFHLAVILVPGWGTQAETDPLHQTLMRHEGNGTPGGMATADVTDIRGESLSQHHSVSHKSHINWTGNESEPLLTASGWFTSISCFILQTWRWTRHVPLDFQRTIGRYILVSQGKTPQHPLHQLLPWCWAGPSRDRRRVMENLSSKTEPNPILKTSATDCWKSWYC